MKRYLAFAGETYYPGGGWEDYIGTYDTIEEARAVLKEKYNHGWWQIVDTTTMQEIE